MMVTLQPARKSGNPTVEPVVSINPLFVLVSIARASSLASLLVCTGWSVTTSSRLLKASAISVSRAISVADFFCSFQRSCKAKDWLIRALLVRSHP